MSKITVLVVLVLLMACETESKKPNSGPSFTNKTQGLAKCNKAVRVLLGNPLSADFKGLGGMGGVSTRLPGSTPRWRVTSHVDTKNAFGATKRTGFKCTVERVEGDRWNLIDLDLTDLGVK